MVGRSPNFRMDNICKVSIVSTRIWHSLQQRVCVHDGPVQLHVHKLPHRQRTRHAAPSLIPVQAQMHSN